jgi:acyl carrier protein
MYEFVEPHVRRVVAERLGVGLEELVSEISLRDDLAADSLDLVELTLALEGEFAIVVSERILDEVRTYSDLVHAIGLLIRARREAEAHGAERPPRIWVRIVPATGESAGTLERTGWLTPYTAETIVEDAVRAGPGARVELTVAASTTEGLVRAQRQFAGLGKRGVLVTVRRDDGPAADRMAEPQQVAVAGAHPTLTDRLLDQLTGARTTVTVTGYAGDDPWQADDLIIARVGQGAKRFGDGTPAEQAQAVSGNGPCQFVDGDPGGGGSRATTEGHHVHAHVDRRSDRAVGPTRDFIEEEPTGLEIGLGFARNARYYQSGRCTAVGLTGELLTSREAAYYSQDREERAFDIASSTTRLTPTGYPSGRQQGIRAHFDMSAPSPNGFRPLRATLDCAAEDGAYALVIHVSSRVAGKDVFGRVTLGGGIGPTMDVRFLPSSPSLDVEGVASCLVDRTLRAAGRVDGDVVRV